MVEYNDKTRPKKKENKGKRRNTFDGISAIYEARKLTLYAFKSGIFPTKATKGKGLEIWTSKQILQILSIALEQVKVGNTFEKILNEIRQIIHSLYRAKEMTKKLYSNKINSIKL